MTIDIHETHLTKGSLATFRALYASLTLPNVASMQGLYQSAFVGPLWLRTIAGPGLYPLGLGGWWGKQFDGQGQGVNIVQRRGRLATKLPVTLAQASAIMAAPPS